MDNPEEDLKGLLLWSLNELVGLTAFQSSFLLFATFGVKLLERHLFDRKLCSCLLQVNSSLASSS